MTGPAAANLVFVSGPPFGEALFRVVIDRLGRGEARSVVDERHPAHGWAERGHALAELCEAPTVLVAHGLAVPAAVQAALVRPPVALVLSNGPIRRVDPITRALSSAAAYARPALAAALLPRLWLRWLASSAGLRRLAVNPYVADRDTVAALCGPSVATPAGRAAVAGYLESLRTLPDAGALRCPTLLLWGDADPLHPASEARFLEARVAGAVHVAIPGGQHLHPEERPWELADRLGAWLGDHGRKGAP